MKALATASKRVTVRTMTWSCSPVSSQRLSGVAGAQRRTRGEGRRMNERAVPRTVPGTERRLRAELGGRRAAEGSRPGSARRGGLVHARGALPEEAAVGSRARPARPRPAP